MKTVGIIGGIGPESTIEYYRLIIAAYRERQRGPGVPAVDEHAQEARATNYPSMIINSVNFVELLALVTANDLNGMTDYLVNEVEKLARAGANFGVIAANTPHLVFDSIHERSPIPLISIVKATCVRAQTLGLEKVGLFGTRFTMQARFYPDVFSRAGITIILPEEEEQSYIHEKYMSDLVNGIILPETRARLLAIVDKMKARDGIEGLILGGTELPLILRDEEHNGVPLLDTTRIHVDRIVGELLS
jgi:aspartate racemase